MQLSRRINNVVQGGSDGWEVHYEGRSRQAAGEPIILLTVGDHDTATPAPFMDALEASLRGGNTGYPPVNGSAPLRAAIAKRLAAKTGVETTPDQVVVTPGGQAALFGAMMAVLDPGDGCLLVEPFYATYDLTVRSASGRVQTVAARAEDHFEPRGDAIEAALDHGTRAIVINSPNNPTGSVYGRETLGAIAEIARERNLWILSDEVYDSQVHDGEHLTIRSFPGMAERCMVIGSMSKSHTMTGWRLGWVAGPAEAAARIADLAIATTYGVPGFIQDAAEAALETGAAEEAEIAARYKRRRDIALAALSNRSGLALHHPSGGMYAMIDIRQTGLSGQAFAHALLDEAGIAVMPGESFGAAAAGHVRIALTVADDRLEMALARIAGFAADRAKRSA